MANEIPPACQRATARRPRKIAVVAVSLLLMFAVAIVAYSLGAGIIQPIIHPVSTPVFENRVLLNGTIAVGADSSFYIQFSVPEGSSSVRILDIKVSGNFEVSDNGTIKVYITDGNNFNPLSPNFSPYYDSGLSTTGTINASITSGGTYYLVYNNYRYNYNYIQTPAKIVTTQVTLTYTMTGT